MLDKDKQMVGVRDYAEEMPVFLDSYTAQYDWIKDPYIVKDREVIVAYNEGGYNCTMVDLLDLIAWLKLHRPELLK